MVNYAMDRANKMAIGLRYYVKVTRISSFIIGINSRGAENGGLLLE